MDKTGAETVVISTRLPAPTIIQTLTPTSPESEPQETATRLFPTITLTPRPTDTQTPSPTGTNLECWEQGGHYEYGVLSTVFLRLPMDYRVYLPPCYEQQSERRYPVLYLIHGQSYTDDQWDRLGADETADRLAAAGELPPFIIVMPRDRYGGQPSENNFAIVIVDELVPLIDENYRTLTDRHQRAVGGLSRGGGWAIHLALNYWQTFGALGGHSPAIFYDDAQYMRVYLENIPPYSYPRIYIDIGDRDRPALMSATIWFVELLNNWDIPHEWYLYNGYHSEEYWREHVEDYLRWYASTW